MGVVSEALFSEPTCAGQFGGVLLHALLWWFFTNLEWGLMGMVERWVKAQPWYPVVQKNYKDSSEQEIYRYDDPGDNFIAFLKTGFHHLWGGSLMVAGMMTGQTWLWRHGMLTEVGGNDVLEFLLILYCKLLPPGTRPTSHNLKSDTYVGLTVFHHSVGICVGIPVNMYFAHVFEFQLFGLIILGGPAFCCLVSACLKLWDSEAHPMIDLFSQVQMLLVFCFAQRVLYFFPAACSCTLTVWRSPECTWSMFLPFVYALTAMSLFNIMVLAIFAKGVKQALLGKTAEDKSVGRKMIKKSAMMGLGARELNAGVGKSQQLTNIFVASRMVGLAKKAKTRASIKAIKTE